MVFLALKEKMKMERPKNKTSCRYKGRGTRVLQILGGLIMYTFFQPRMSVSQEEDYIKAMIDEEYERKKQEERDYYKLLEEDYYKHLEDQL